MLKIWRMSASVSKWLCWERSEPRLCQNSSRSRKVCERRKHQNQNIEVSYTSKHTWSESKTNNTVCPKEGRQYTLREGMEQTRSKDINMHRCVSCKHSCGNEDAWANPTDISKREETTKGNGANPFVCQIVPHLLKMCKYKMPGLLYLPSVLANM